MTRVRYVSAVKYTEPFERRRGLFKHDSEIWDWSYAALGSHELLPPENSTQNARQPFAPTQEVDGRSAQVMAVMSKWVLWLMFAVCIGAHADEHSVEFDYRKAPAWPYSLSKSGISGWVVYDLVAHHDGRVSEPEVLDSSHPLFSLAVVKVVPTWRVKPWVVSEQRPAVISLRQEHYFVHPREGNAAVPWLHRSLRHLSCAKFNKRFEDFQQNSSDLEQVEMSVFRHTYSVLARVATYRKLSDEDRFALGDALADAVPEVIQRCRATPELRYKDVLPDQVRRML